MLAQSGDTFNPSFRCIAVLIILKETMIMRNFFNMFVTNNIRNLNFDFFLLQTQVGFAEFNNTADNRANIGGTIIGAPIVGQ